MDWPAAILWPNARVRCSPSADTAARAARLSAYALARLAGFRDHAHRFARGPIDFAATFLPAHACTWHEDGALAALGPTLEALGDALNRPAAAFRSVAVAVDFAPRLGIVIVQVTPSPDPHTATEGAP